MAKEMAEVVAVAVAAIVAWEARVAESVAPASSIKCREAPSKVLHVPGNRTPT